MRRACLFYLKMDEIAKRREIRQRRILENAEARMRKIIGGPSGSELTSEEYNSRKIEYGLFGSGNAGSFSAEEGETSTAKVSFPNDWNSRNTGFSTSYASRSTESFQTNFLAGLSQGDADSISNGISHRANVSDSYAFPKKVSDAETRSFGRTRADSRRNSSCKQIMMETLQFSSLKCTILRPWIAMVVGICTKLLFVWYHSFLFDSLLLPYILLELSLYIWMKLETQGNARSVPQSMLLTALMLCGISSPLISMLNNLLNTMQYVIQDFSIYLFSFVLSHFLYENYVI